MSIHEIFMREDIRLAAEGVRRGDGGPFGAVVVCGAEVKGRGWNRVVTDNDPTAHAEINAIGDACRRLGDFRLAGCRLYSACQPCLMCLAAAYWARLEHVWYAATGKDAEAIGFDDSHIRSQLAKPEGKRLLLQGQLPREETLAVFRRWRESGLREDY